MEWLSLNLLGVTNIDDIKAKVVCYLTSRKHPHIGLTFTRDLERHHVTKQQAVWSIQAAVQFR